MCERWGTLSRAACCIGNHHDSSCPLTCREAGPSESPAECCSEQSGCGCGSHPGSTCGEAASAGGAAASAPAEPPWCGSSGPKIDPGAAGQAPQEPPPAADPGISLKRGELQPPKATAAARDSSGAAAEAGRGSSDAPATLVGWGWAEELLVLGVVLGLFGILLSGVLSLRWGA